MRQCAISAQKRFAVWQLHNARPARRRVEGAGPCHVERVKKGCGLSRKFNKAYDELNAECGATSVYKGFPCVGRFAEGKDDEEDEP